VVSRWLESDAQSPPSVASTASSSELKARVIETIREPGIGSSSGISPVAVITLSTYELIRSDTYIILSVS